MHGHARRMSLIGVVLAFAGALALSPGARAAELPPVAPVMSCTDLLALDLSGLEGAPARIETATVVRENTPRPYCAVTGYVASAVRFEVRLPLEGWTQRFLLFGCGGYCGGVNVDNPSPRRHSAGCLPLEQGEFVLATSDMGHRRSAAFFPDGLWAVGNPGAVVDFAYAGMRKTTLVAKALIRAFYGQPPRYSYFSGCSDGGRQGLQEAQRFPEDFDGILAGAPTINVIATNTFYHAWNARVNSRPDGQPILTARKIPALAAAVDRACGDEGGLIQDPRACNFDPRSILCPAGADRDDCLTEAEARVARQLWDGPVDDRGRRLAPGDMPYGSERAWIGTMVPARAGAPVSLATASDYQWSWDFPNYMARFGRPTGITNRNMEFSETSFRMLHELQGLYEPTNPDLRPFAARGGRLLMWHGWVDQGASPHMALNYADAVRRETGAEAAERFLSLYMIPGVYHCNVGPQATSFDLMTPLMRWVEDGVAPGRITVNFLAGATDPRVVRTRPAFPYPSTVRYRGQGDLASAESFLEVRPERRPEDRYEWLGNVFDRTGRTSWCEWEGASMVCRNR